MSNARAKADTITFKVDAHLAEAMRGIENRSEFIRNAILAALDNTCPLCGGAGVLTPPQKEHWSQFSRTHHLAECAECHELHLCCEAEDPNA